jgi:hypothetical protein
VSNGLVVADAGALSLLADLERSGKITPTSLVIDDPDFPWEKWVAIGGFFGELRSRLSFYIGDWILFGDRMYGERYAQAIDVTGLSEGAIANKVSTCRNVAGSRRRETLSFGHHTEVSKLEPAEQAQWLEHADANRWNRATLRVKLDEAGHVRRRYVQPAAPEPLAPRQIVDAAANITVIHDALERIHHGEIATVDLPRALRAVDRSAETLKVASRVPTILDAVERLLEHAEPTEDGSGYTVAAAVLDELRTLVVSEGGKG